MASTNPQSDVTELLLSSLGLNAPYVLDLYSLYRANPETVPSDWRHYFQGVERGVLPVSDLPGRAVSQGNGTPVVRTETPPPDTRPAPEEELKPLRVLVLWDALPKTYAFDGMSVVLPRAGGETRPSVQWHWQRIITEAFVGQPLAPMMPTAQTMIEDLPITKKSPAATGTADGGHED